MIETNTQAIDNHNSALALLGTISPYLALTIEVHRARSILVNLVDDAIQVLIAKLVVKFLQNLL